MCALVSLNPGIEQHIARAGVPAAHSAVYGQVGDVGDAADVGDDAVRLGMLQHLGVEGGHQRRALAACCDVTAAEIGDDGDAREFGKQGGIDYLQRVAISGTVAQGLSVAANRTHGVGRNAIKQVIDRVGVQVRQFIGGTGGEVDFVGLRRVQCQQLGAQGVCVRQVVGAGEAGAGLWGLFRRGLHRHHPDWCRT